MTKRPYLLLLCLFALVATLAYVYWPTVLAPSATRLPSPSPVEFQSLPVGTRAAHLFWSNRFAEFDRLLDSALADTSRPGDIESALSTTCDRGTAARRDAELWQTQMPASLWPSLCIGRAFLQQGIQARGRELSANTAPGRFDRMQAAFDDANARVAPFYSDAAYRRAVVIPVLSRLQFAGVNASGDDPTLGYDAVYATAVKAHPAMDALYLHRINKLRPQWGGSLERMQAFVAEAQASGAPAPVVKQLAATVARTTSYEQWKGNPQRPAESLEREIGTDIGADDYENLALDLEKMGRPESAAKARDEAVRRYPVATMPLVRRGNGLAARKDVQAGYRDFVDAANRGDYWALNRIVTALGYGEAPIEKDWDALRLWVEYGVSIGHAMSDHVLGTIYLQGLAGIAPDRAKAMALYRRAARHGNDNAQHDLGALLLQAAKSDSDKQEAIDWLREAARQGHRFAREKLAGMGVSYREVGDAAK